MQVAKFAANVMADTFMSQRDEKGDITPRGEDILKDVFGEVSPEDRADTYMEFISILDERGFEFSVEEIQNIN